MAQYTGPDPNTLLPGDPWTSALAQAAFEDPIAIAEGAPGAPRLRGLAAMTVAEYLSLFPLSVDVGNFAVNPEAYDGIFSSASTTSSSFVSCGIIEAVFFSGNARFEATQTAVGSVIGEQGISGTNNTRFLKNGVEIQSWFLSQQGTTPTSITRTVEISVSVGDTFEWQVRRSSGDGEQTTSPRGPRVDDTVVSVGLPIKRSEQ